MKLRILPWIIIIILLITQVPGYEFFKLNKKSLTTVHNLMASSSLSSQDTTVIKFRNSSLFCHGNWLDFIQIVSTKEKPIFSGTFELMACSTIHMRMLRKIYPDNLELAIMAVQLYPDETAPLFWVLQATDPNISEESKPVIKQILSLSPKNGLAWRYLGIILIREGDIPGAIEAHINCCMNGDPGVNGCYNAGRLLEKEGQFEEAIYYYRLSRWQPSQEAADLLEEGLGTSP